MAKSKKKSTKKAAKKKVAVKKIAKKAVKPKVVKAKRIVKKSLKPLPFIKMAGSGNDFILVDLRDITIRRNWSNLAKKYCVRNWSVGADGVLVLSKSKTEDVKMQIFNPDGSEAEMCGNGARCVALYELERTKRKTVSIQTISGVIKGQRQIDTRIKLRMNDPVDLDMDIKLHIKKKTYPVYFVTMGVPHTIYFVKNINKIEADDLGPAICHHDRFAPKGTNVNFVQMTSRSHIQIRTYERGVEKETFACGTGAAASAVISALNSVDIKFNIPHVISVDTPGGESLRVYFIMTQDKITDVWLEGDAHFVYKGVLEDV